MLKILVSRLDERIEYVLYFLNTYKILLIKKPYFF